MWIEKNAMLHVVDLETTYNAAIVSKNYDIKGGLEYYRDLFGILIYLILYENEIGPN